MEAIGYVRVSTDEQAESGLGLAAQRRKLKALAEVGGYRLADVIEDCGQSGRTMDRPGWQSVMAAVAGRNGTPRPDAVLVAKLDRCTRSVADMATIIDLCDRHGVALVSAGESLNTKTAAGRLVANILVSVAQWERETISERTSAAMQELRQKGRATGGVAPFGYRFVRGRRVVNEVEQRALRVVRTLQASGKSYAECARALNTDGMRTRGGGLWSAASVHRIGRGRS